MKRTGSNAVLVCYDVTSDRLRRLIDKCLKDFGVRLQFSVFLCHLNDIGTVQCRNSLLKLLEKYRKETSENDSLIIFNYVNTGAVDCLIGEKIDQEPTAFQIF